MAKVYFALSKTENTSKEWNEFLEENRKKLKECLRYVRVTDNEFKQYYTGWLGGIESKLGKRFANTFSETDVRALITFFHKALGIKKDVSLTGKALIKYIYELSNKFYNLHYPELQNKYMHVLKGTSEVNSDIIEGIILERPKEFTNGSSRYNRNTSYSAKVIKQAKYSCEFNKEHSQFVSEATNKNYVEAHHLIPLEFQQQFEYSLDVIGNMVALCVICHKKLHHSKFIEKEDILVNLYNMKRNDLIGAGITISLEQFLNLYKGTVSED